MKQRALVWLALAFLLPLIMAALALKLEWYQSGSANRGQWMSSTIISPQLQTHQGLPEAWKLVYNLPSNCALHCQNLLQNMADGYATLGRKQVQVKLLLLANAESSTLRNESPLPAELSASLLSGLSAVVLPEHIHKQLSANDLYIVDQQGQFILRYAVGDEPFNYAQLTRDWLADMKRLLSFSRSQL